MKDKIEAVKEVKAKEQEEKDVIAQQVNPSVLVSIPCLKFSVFVGIRVPAVQYFFLYSKI